MPIFRENTLQRASRNIQFLTNMPKWCSWNLSNTLSNCFNVKRFVEGRPVCLRSLKDPDYLNFLICLYTVDEVKLLSWPYFIRKLQTVADKLLLNNKNAFFCSFVRRSILNISKLQHIGAQIAQNSNHEWIFAILFYKISWTIKQMSLSINRLFRLPISCNLALKMES